MLELTLSADMAVTLLNLKKQAQFELGKTYSIASEDEVAALVLDAATFEHRHSRARLLALEIVDGLEKLDQGNQYREFIAECRSSHNESIDLSLIHI